MSRHDDAVRMQHMLEYAREAVTLARGKTRADLESDRVLNLALVRLLEIIGEAANRVSKATQAAHPAIPWSEIVSLRNRLIHGYDSVDMDILHEILTTDLPQLIATLEKIVPPKRET
jgi:uncharacterized protein with HEPN domain